MTSINEEICDTIKAYRYDCGCLYYECEESSESAQTIEACLQDRFYKIDDKYDFGCDQLETTSDIVLSEAVNVCSEVFDGNIDNFFCLLDGGDNCEFPVGGKIKHKDDYGIIYVAEWEAHSNRIDITWTTYDPRVSGEDPEGFVVDKQVYRKGIITTTRQVLDRDEDDNVTIVEETYEQKVDFFRTTFDCGDEVFNDEFRYHYDCAVTDELEIDELGGSSNSE